MQNSNPISKDSQSINLLDLVMYLLSKWKWFLLSVIICGGLAWLHYARTPKVYFRQATVIIKDPSNKTSSAAGLDRYDNIINKVNVANEILQFRTKMLMREVVSRLNAEISYKLKDGFRYNELYNRAPFAIRFPDALPESYFTLNVTLKSPKQAEVTFLGDNEKTLTVNLNDTVASPYGKMVVTPTMYSNDTWVGTRILVTKFPLSYMASYYQGMMGIQQEEDEASILTLSLKDSSPERADDVLNMLITVYNEDAVNDKNQVAVNTANFINERLIIIEKELGGVESDLESFKRENQIVDIGSTAGRYMTESQKYNADAVELETQIRLAKYLKEYLTDPNRELDLLPANTGIKDMNIETQIGLYNTARLRRDKLIADSSEQNPIVEELNNSLHSMKQSIIRAVDNMIVNLNVRRSDAQSQEMRAQARVSSIPTKERQMLSIERQQKIKESLYLFLLNRREENALSQAMADNNARIIDTTDGPTSPIAPSRNRILLLGILVGIAIPGVVFLMILFMDTRVHSRKDVQGAVSVPFLGEVPLERSKKRKSSDDEADDDSTSDRTRPVAEAMRMICDNLSWIKKEAADKQVITFTSFNEGAGKTFIARNLAQSYIYAHKRVIILDLDLRKHTMSNLFDGHRHRGISNYLHDASITIDEIIHKGEEGKTPDIIMAGPKPVNPAELLMDGRLDSLIAELRTRYDVIIADNVPMGIIADATIANRIADITIFVVRAGRLDRRQLPDIEKIYQDKRLKNMTLVLNGIDLHRVGYGYGYGYGRYGYGYGYGYGAKKSEKK